MGVFFQGKKSAHWNPQKSCAIKAFSFLVICHKAVYNKDSYRYPFENEYLQGSEMGAGVYDIADARHVEPEDRERNRQDFWSNFCLQGPTPFRGRNHDETTGLVQFSRRTGESVFIKKQNDFHL